MDVVSHAIVEDHASGLPVDGVALELPRDVVPVALVMLHATEPVPSPVVASTRSTVGELVAASHVALALADGDSCVAEVPSGTSAYV